MCDVLTQTNYFMTRGVVPCLLARTDANRFLLYKWFINREKLLASAALKGTKTFILFYFLLFFSPLNHSKNNSKGCQLRIKRNKFSYLSNYIQCTSIYKLLFADFSCKVQVTCLPVMRWPSATGLTERA